MLKENDVKKSSLLNDIYSVLFSEEEIDKIVCRIANEITEAFKEKVLKNNEKLVIIAILNGSFQFVSDLVKKIDLPLQVEFMFASSYGNATKSSGEVEIKVGKNADVLDDPDAHLVIIEDIVDSGNTLSKILKNLKGKNNKSVSLCALFDKPDRRETAVDLQFVGARIPDEFIVGYGLDYCEKYRNLPYVGILKREIYE